MKQLTLTFCILLINAFSVLAKDEPKTPEVDSAQMKVDKFESALSYKTGDITIGDNLAKIKVPAGFKFLDAKDAQKVVYELWGNPRENVEKLYGMLIPDKMKATGSDCWAFIVEYDDMGYVKDDDADKIDYADMLKQLQEGEVEENKERTKAGYPSVHMVGWAEQPFYDKERKVLHWAKEIDFAGNPEHTLNYNVRVLGRKGVMVLNAVGGIGQLAEIKQTISGVLGSVTYSEGSRYTDFNPSMDNVAAVGIGGLVAGKVLAKVGFFAIIAKFGKIIFLAIAGFGAGVWQWIKKKMGRGEEEAEAQNDEPNIVQNDEETAA
jgi:uncharacterized membrane-anchored protein